MIVLTSRASIMELVQTKWIAIRVSVRKDSLVNIVKQVRRWMISLYSENNCSRIFISCYLYGTCEHAKIWAKIITARMRKSAAEWRFASLKGGGLGKIGTLSSPLGEWLHNKMITSEEGAYILCWTPMGIIRRSPDEMCLNVCTHFGAILSMKIVRKFKKRMV